MSPTSPSELTSPPAARRAGRPGWRDPRLVLGVLVVAVSVLAGASLLGTDEDTAAVWSARKDLPAGTRLTVDLVRQRAVHFPDRADLARYLTGPLPEGEMLSRPVGSGELVPRGALGGSARHLVEVPLRVDVDDVPATVREGSTVDVWVAPRDVSPGDSQRARRVLAEVVVVRLPRVGSSLAPETSRQVIVAVPPGAPLADALGATSTGRVVITRQG